MPIAPELHVLDERRPRDRVVVLHPAADARYRRLVAAVTPTVEAGLAEAVAANRVAFASVTPPWIELRSWRTERRRYAVLARRLAASSAALLVTDVRRCYASIRPSTVGEGLARLGVKRRDLDPIVAFLRWLGTTGVAGLPIGPVPSAVLANAVLAGVDEALAEVGHPHLRWVDDVVVAIPSVSAAAEVLEVVDAALATLGLARHVGKTRIASPGDVARVPLSGASEPAGRRAADALG